MPGVFAFPGVEVGVDRPFQGDKSLDFAVIFVVNGFGIIDHPDYGAMIIENSASAGAFCEVGGDGHKRLIASGITPEGVAGYLAASEEIELAVGVADHADGRAYWGGSGG